MLCLRRLRRCSSQWPRRRRSLQRAGLRSRRPTATITSLPDGSVYQANDDGTFSLIPDVATANAMKLVWNTLQPVDEVPGPTAAPFASVVPLVNPSFNRLAGVPLTRANGNDVVLPDGSVYQGNDDGTYSWIPNVATANAMGVVWNALQPVDELPGPEGTAFPSVFG